MKTTEFEVPMIIGFMILAFAAGVAVGVSI